MAILNFWLDFDGCANSAICTTFEVDGQPRYYADINNPLIVDIITQIEVRLRNLREPSEKVIAVISSGSNRQNFSQEMANMDKRVSATANLVTITAVQGLTAIYSTIRDYFKNERRVHIYLDKYLLEDSILSGSAAAGTTWNKIDEYIYDQMRSSSFLLKSNDLRNLSGKYQILNPKRDVDYFDDNKIILIYLKAHRAVMSAYKNFGATERDKIQAFFYDDNARILECIEKSFKRNPNLLPENGRFSLELQKFDANYPILSNQSVPLTSAPSSVSSTLQGTGEVNQEWYTFLTRLKARMDFAAKGLGFGSEKGLSIISPEYLASKEQDIEQYIATLIPTVRRFAHQAAVQPSFFTHLWQRPSIAVSATENHMDGFCMLANNTQRTVVRPIIMKTELWHLNRVWAYFDTQMSEFGAGQPRPGITGNAKHRNFLRDAAAEGARKNG